MRFILLGLFFLLPCFANAAVSVSELAWMGSVVSANHEWIELHNDGAAIDVTGWILTDGMNLEIELEGVVPANSYIVLERTSDASAPGTAFLIYTGALVNTGATLRLMREDGSLVDQVPGGEDWVNVGGDNVTKETAQYTTNGWKTAPSTPGAALLWNEDMEEAEPSDSQGKTENVSIKRRSSSGETVRLTLPGITLALVVTAQKVGYVHQPISFTVEPSGIGDNLINSLEYQWNFGDGFVSTEKDAEHIFLYPGTYVVTVYGGFKRQEQVERHEITILPVKVSLTTSREGDVQINNDSPYELDISGYYLRGDEAFTFPPYSILLPNQTITIPKKKLGSVRGKMVALYDTETAMVSSITPDHLSKVALAGELDTSSVPQVSLTTQTDDLVISAVPVVDSFTFAPKEAETEKEQKIEQDIIISESSSTQLANVSTSDGGTKQPWTHLALAGVMIVGVIGVLTIPRREEKLSSIGD